MSAGSQAATSGGILGLAFVLLFTQLSYLYIGAVLTAVVDILAAIIVGAILCAVIGWRLGIRYRRFHPGSVSEWKAPSPKSGPPSK